MTKEDKVAKVMHEWKQGKLTSHGKVVTDYDQAIAIALSEAGLSKKMEEGGWVLYDEDDERLIKVYETESEARKNLYEYEGNANIVEKSSWDNNQYAEGGAITDKSWAKINETLWDKGEIMVIDESKFGGEKVFSVENNLTKDVKEFEDKKEAYKYAIEVSSMPSGTKMLYLYKLGYKKEAYEIRKSSKSEISENSTFESFKRVMDKVVDSKNEVYSSKKYAGGGGIKKYYDVFYSTKGGGSMVAKNIEASSEEEAKEKLTKQMRASSSFDKPIAVIQKYADGGGVESEKVKEGDILISNYSDYYKLIKLGNGYFEVGKLDIHNKIKNFINIPEDFSEQSLFKKANKEELEDFYNDINTDEDYAKGGELRSFNDRIFGKIIIFKEEQIGKFTIGIKSGFNNNRHVFIYEGKKGSYGSNGLPRNFKMTPQISIADANKIYSELKIKAKNNQNLEPFEIMKEKFAEGGGIGEENALMVANNNKQIAHHTEEMESALKDVDYVPAWVVAKVNRSASDLSDATHYLEGSEYKNEKKENMNKYEGGGEAGKNAFLTNAQKNKIYLDDLSLRNAIFLSKKLILENISENYGGIGIKEVESEIYDNDAEMLYEYIANDDDLRIRVYGEMEFMFRNNRKFAVGGGVEGVDWDKDEDGYRTKLGDFDIRISPSTQKGYWDIYVREKTKTISNKYDVYGIDNAKNIAYDIVGDYMKKFEGGGEIEAKIEKLKKNVLNSKFVSDSVKETARKQIEKFEKELEESKETKSEEKKEHNKAIKTFKDSKTEAIYTIEKSPKKDNRFAIYSESKDWSRRIEFDDLVSLEDAIELAMVSSGSKKEIDPEGLFMRNEDSKLEDKKAEAKSEEKVGVSKIKILWAEGDNSKYDKFPKQYSSWSLANKAIIPVYKDTLGNEGYNKLKFEVTFKDGETYDGRLDVSEREDNPTKSNNVIGQHIKEFLDYMSSDKSRESDSYKKEIKDWLEKYDLGLDTKETKTEDDNYFNLKGKSIDIFYMGVETPETKTITSAKVTPEKYSVREVTLTTKNGTVSVFPMKKTNAFMNGEEIEIKGGKEVYIIKLNKSEEKPATKKPGTKGRPTKVVKAKKEVKSKVVGDDLKVIKFFDLTESDWNKMALNERNKLSESYKEKTKKPKVDRKKVVEKAKAKKKSIEDYSNKASLNVKTGERRKRNESSDKKRDALPLGKRVSADGNVYYENRLNHADFDKKEKFEKGGEVKSSGFGLNFLKW